MGVWIRSFPRRSAKRRRLSLPASSGKLRIAQLSLPDSLFEEAVYFPPRRGGGLEEFQPQLLIGSAGHLGILAQAAEAGQLKLASLSFAVYSITACRDMPLNSEARRSLWHAFGVPVHELLLDADDLPVAVECDAHEGWHVEPGVTFVEQDGQLWFQRKRDLWRGTGQRGTGLTGRIESAPCPCGRPDPRILNPQLDFHDPLRQRLAV